MMSNIPLKCLIGSFALVSLTGCDVFANKGFCQITDQGYEICIKKENISCKRYPPIGSRDSDLKGYDCTAFGISKDAAGEENHWNGRRYRCDLWEYEFELDYDDVGIAALYSNIIGMVRTPDKWETIKNIHCGAAKHFGMLKEGRGYADSKYFKRYEFDKR